MSIENDLLEKKIRDVENKLANLRSDLSVVFYTDTQMLISLEIKHQEQELEKFKNLRGKK